MFLCEGKEVASSRAGIIRVRSLDDPDDDFWYTLYAPACPGKIRRAVSVVWCVRNIMRDWAEDPVKYIVVCLATWVYTGSYLGTIYTNDENVSRYWLTRNETTSVCREMMEAYPRVFSVDFLTQRLTDQPVMARFLRLRMRYSMTPNNVASRLLSTTMSDICNVIAATLRSDASDVFHDEILEFVENHVQIIPVNIVQQTDDGRYWTVVRTHRGSPKIQDVAAAIRQATRELELLPPRPPLSPSPASLPPSSPSHQDRKLKMISRVIIPKMSLRNIKKTSPSIRENKLKLIPRVAVRKVFIRSIETLPFRIRLLPPRTTAPAIPPISSIDTTATFIKPPHRSLRSTSGKDTTPLVQLLPPKKQSRGRHVDPTKLNITSSTLTSSPTTTSDDTGYISTHSEVVTSTPKTKKEKKEEKKTSKTKVIVTTTTTTTTTTSIPKKKLYKGKATPGLQIKGSSKGKKTPKKMYKRQFYRDAMGPGVPSTSRQVPSSSRHYFPETL